MIARLKIWAKQLKSNILALYWAYRDPRVSWYAKAFVALVVTYALSPIDLIPDFIPVLGYLDDLILLPAGIYLAIKLIPPDVLEDCRHKASTMENKPVSRAGLILIVCLWVVIAAIVIIWLRHVSGM